MTERPNLIYMFADQLRLQSMGYYGDQKAKTPNIDKLSDNSCNLCNAVSGHPVCAPYRATLFTGKYTSSTGMVINEIRLSPNHTSIAHVLTRNNYNVGYIGKWHLYANEWGNHYDPKNSFIPQGPNRLGFDQYFAAYNFHHENFGQHSYYHLDSPEKIFYDGFEPDCQTDLAIKKIEEYSKQDKPFAMFLSIGIPHDPWDEWNCDPEAYSRFSETVFDYPENYSSENDKYADNWAKLSPKEREQLPYWMKGYYSMAAKVDDNVGKMVDAIERLGLSDNTIFIFTSDHGEMFGAHGRRAKNIFYEESCRIPFLIKWGNKIPFNKNDICINTVDLMPTLLSMMGMKNFIPEEVEGRDCSDAIFGAENAVRPKGALMMGTGATAKWEDGHEWRAWRTEQYTYATYLKDGKELLFDNLNDPLQMNDLSDNPNYQEIKSQLKFDMWKEMIRVNDKFHPSSYYKNAWCIDRIIQKNKAD